MNFLFSKTFLVTWGIVGPLLGFLLGPGFIWEWRKTNIESGRLDIERARASLEIRKEMSSTLEELLKLQVGSPERLRKERFFNETEKH